ncbi:hypothetical protein Hanom_Chr02g00099851 [Helianthus anomalus]
MDSHTTTSAAVTGDHTSAITRTLHPTDHRSLSLSLTPLCLFILTLSPLSRTSPFIGKLQTWKRNYTSGDRKLNRSGNSRVSV